MNRPVASTLLALCLVASAALAVEPPRVLDPDWTIELVSAEPDLVTPTGCCLDDAGRLLIVECHTHFPPQDYQGPATDRVYLFDDSDGDGTLDRKHLFYEGGAATMNIANLGGGWFALATRSELVRIRDSDGDQVADQREVLLTHQTAGTYPHNGLGGLVLGPDGWLYVGQGENLGEPYELIGSDGSKQVGGGEGGNIFRCRVDGTRVQRVATGFWNPFGLCFDSAQRLWTVGNDPDSMPPCRLLHVTPGGDYGFQFRFGRAGIHPLQAWNGELPGTLPMAAGTGEATCAVAQVGEHLWVTSWGDNRIERYAMQPHGASWTGETQVLVQGGADFRPVGMAVASDGSVYITDWVDRSYPVHGKGRLWRVSRRLPADVDVKKASLPQLTEAEKTARRLQTDPAINTSERLRELRSTDPFLCQAAAFGLVHTRQLETIRPQSLREQAAQEQATGQAAWVLAAWRWQELVAPQSVSAETREKWISWALETPSDEAATIAAIRWASERNCGEQLPKIRGLLDRDDLSVQLFSAVVAAVAYLETGSAAGGKRDPAMEKRLLEFAADPMRAARLRAFALRSLPAEAEAPSDQQLGEWLSGERDRAFALEVIRLLTARGSKAASDVLAATAGDETFDDQTRADAIAGLARQAGTYAAVINKAALPQQPAVLRQEALRILRRTWDSEQTTRPRRENLSAWTELVGSGGDVEAGRRVFSRTTCINCHAHSGRGAKTGPDLTTLSGQMTPQRVLESILQPSKEVGPLYVPWQIVTVDGRVLTGLKLDRAGEGGSRQFQGADGDLFEVALADIETQNPLKESIMPAGLEEAMSVAEMRDLVAFLTAPR